MVIGIVFGGFALNFGLSGFVSILRGIQHGVDNIPFTFDVIWKQFASICRWEGDIFSHMIFGPKNCTES